jgi:hypothetical protein
MNSENIQAEFRRRDAAIAPDFYSLTRDVNLFFYQGRVRSALALLRRCGFFPCTDKTVLEIGCGARGWLPDFEAWGVSRENLAGIELDETRARVLQRLLSGYPSETDGAWTGGADIRVGDAAQLPWSDGAFDLVVQSTVFTSILEPALRRAVAAEMLRVTRSTGLVLWYDFVFNNPSNPNVRGVKLAEVKELFPHCDVTTCRVTLAPPLARRLVPFSWLAAELLQNLRIFNTHRLVIIRKSPDASAAGK